ncbi:MAG TPA: T9SS type A sorting domain-containing protein, partial [Chryseolinea sp.]|nr:T9SS type A sorting domain-containing protein [Chryseolinea sp.]
WTASNEGLPMFQNSALIIFDNILFGSFRGDKSVWSQPVENTTTGIGPYPQTHHSSCHDIGINAYPSPTLGYIHIDADELGYGLTEIIISDVSGKPLHRTELNSTGDTTLDISDFVAGMYVVKVSYDQKICYTKFVKQ